MLTSGELPPVFIKSLSLSPSGVQELKECFADAGKDAVFIDDHDDHHVKVVTSATIIALNAYWWGTTGLRTIA